MEVRVLPPQLDVKKVGDLARLEADEELERDFKRIVEFVDALGEVPDVEPLFSLHEGYSPLREDEPDATLPEIYTLAPDTEGRYIRFLSPIGRKT